MPDASWAAAEPVGFGNWLSVSNHCQLRSGKWSAELQAVDLLPRETMYKAEATRVARQLGASRVLQGPLPECPAGAGIVLLSCRIIGPISYSCGCELQLQFMLCDWCHCSSCRCVNSDLVACLAPACLLPALRLPDACHPHAYCVHGACLASSSCSPAGS